VGEVKIRKAVPTHIKPSMKRKKKRSKDTEEGVNRNQKDIRKKVKAPWELKKSEFLDSHAWPDL